MLQQRLSFIALLLVLLFSRPISSNAEIQNLPFRRISPAGGFTLSPVIEIAEDKQGFIWFVTREKLYQYNSQDFISFEPIYPAGTGPIPFGWEPIPERAYLTSISGKWMR
jgi:hypothetical protein